MSENKDFKPYIPAEKVTPEITVTSVIVGVLLAIIFGAANAYLGLRVGLTVSALSLIHISAYASFRPLSLPVFAVFIITISLAYFFAA